MTKHIKLLLLGMLALLIATGLVYAQPVYIGQTVQPVPFESNPTAYTETIGTTITGPDMMYDGDLFTSGNFYLGYSMGSSQYFEVKTFTTPVLQEWDPEWVEIKMKYEVPSAATDDKYIIEYSTDGSTWNTLEDNGGLKYPKFDLAIRPWSQLDEPTDGVWTWSDISSLRVRVYCTKMGLGWDNKKIYIYELWVSVYPAPLPPVSSTTVSVQPEAVTRLRPYDYMLGGTQGLFFVELYVNDVADFYGYQFVLYFDTDILTPTGDYFGYYPWTLEGPGEIRDDLGYVSLSFEYFTTVSVGEAFYGGSPIARIYFLVDAYGGGGGGGCATCDLTISPTETILSDSKGDPISFTTYDGWFSGSRYMSGIYPGGDPAGTSWHEMYPQYCNTYTVVADSWEDTDLSGDLSRSDQIKMYNETDGTTKEYHVDDVTITIHYTFKAGTYEGELGAAEPYEPIDPPITSPYGYWHQIYGPTLDPVLNPNGYCRWFEITSWDEVDTPGEPGVFDPSDQFDFYYLDEGTTYWAHLDEITVDILVSEKPPVPEVPEFPLGAELPLMMALAMSIVYLWRRGSWTGRK